MTGVLERMSRILARMTGGRILTAGWPGTGHLDWPAIGAALRDVGPILSSDCPMETVAAMSRTMSTKPTHRPAFELPPLSRHALSS